ncbi:hypothetical protein EYF80_007391 [Liparis tanakae]|uniref:Uncharacterized protein n=1 Tax=Liparis tanakae TaxID=230148 RepID=A0A4Z2IWY6_9TELE|nr:hypothetical protein EYF80_007391 [Liparis tanakae]
MWAGLAITQEEPIRNRADDHMDSMQNSYANTNPIAQDGGAGDCGTAPFTSGAGLAFPFCSVSVPATRISRFSTWSGPRREQTARKAFHSCGGRRRRLKSTPGIDSRLGGSRESDPSGSSEIERQNRPPFEERLVFSPADTSSLCFSGLRVRRRRRR